MRNASLATQTPAAGRLRQAGQADPGRKWIWIGFVLLFAVHHDFWWWDDRTLVLGFLPISLAYHAAFSAAAGLLWLLALRYAWPAHIEAWADEPGLSADAVGADTGTGEGRI